MEQKLQYEIRRSKRKTLEVSVYPDGRIIVRAPERMSRKAVCEFVESKRDWILSKIAFMSQKREERKTPLYEEGSKVWYLGKEYLLHIVLHEEETGWIECKKEMIEVHCPSKDPEVIKYLLVLWYKENAKKIIKSRVRHYCDILGEEIGTVRIKDQKTRFGSCSSKRNLNFNFRLIMAPEKVIDYVVVHELCHLKYMNHAKEFWAYVEQVMPDYREYDRWLKEHTADLLL